MFPRPPDFVASLRSVTIPAKVGAPTDVPPTRLKLPALSRNPLVQFPCEHSRYPSWSAEAFRAMSGTSRFPSLGTPAPVCQLGLLKTELAPPPLAEKVPPWAMSNVVSFQLVSGM